MRKLELPEWAEVVGQGKIEMNADGFYTEWLALLGIPMGNITQYDLEMAFQCAKLDIQFAVAGTEFVPQGGALVLLVKDTSKAARKHRVTGKEVFSSLWAQDIYPEGRGILAASKGGEARAAFRRIRNIPSL